MTSEREPEPLDRRAIRVLRTRASALLRALSPRDARDDRADVDDASPDAGEDR